MNRAIAFVLALAAAGCASFGGALRPGASTESEVRATMGAPAMEFTDPDGSRQLVYPKGPLGTDTLMVYLGKDGVLRDDVRNVLTDQTFESVKAGLTEKDIQRLIGPPAQVIPFALSNTHAWDYRYMDTWGYLAIFSVTFDANGIVVSKSKARINDGKSRGM